MTEAASTKPTRRVAVSRKTRIVDSSDEENEENVSPPSPVSDGEYSIIKASHTQHPARGGKLKQVAAVTVAPSTRHAPAKTSTTKRRSVRAGRKSLATTDIDQSILPTPEPSVSPEPEERAATPLADITKSVLNEQETIVPDEKTPTKNTLLPAIKEERMLEKPRDIAIRARAKAELHTEVPLAPKPRIVITYLILTNFKSYAGRQEIGPFHASFSSVVGPNGSGKSNVIDSLLFVFGFRASKMRQGKISALIHNSAGFPDLEYCEVEVHFEEVMDQPCGGAPQVIPNSTLVISRRAFKNNSSKYYINGSGSDFTTVTTLLKDRGVDLDHKRFLILQGEVESIAQMKPKAATEHDDGLLEYLEDIIGTSKYKTPIEESAAEAEALNEVCLEKNSRVQHVEKEKNSLEGKKDAALAYIRDENELTLKQSSLYQLFVSECNNNIDVTQQAVQLIQNKLEAESQSHGTSQKAIAKLEKECATEAKQFDTLEQDTQAMLKQMAKADKDNVKLEEKKKFLNTKSKKLEKTMSTSRASANESTAYVGRLADDLQGNLEAISDLEEQVKREELELSSIRDGLKEKTQGLSDEIAKKQQSLEPWTLQINEKRSALAVAESEVAMIQEQDAATLQAVVDAKEKILSLKEEKTQRKQELASFEKDKVSMATKVQELEHEVRQLQKIEPETRTKLSTARQKADEARASLSHTQTQGNVLSSLIRLAESGRLDGFHGRLGNLGTIDQKYDVAISTACPALDNFVVENVDVGQRCIEHLRKNNLGRANFILLDRLANRDLSSFETPEGVPRLFDLVRPKDKKFQAAFFSVLQNTLVARDLDQANRIAYGAKRYRVVTLDGQLIDKSGTMSGGGTKVNKGAMSAKLVADTTKEQVAKLEIERDNLESHHRKIQNEQDALQAEMKQIADALPELETRIQKCLLGIDSIDRNIADAEKRFGELDAAKKPDTSAKSRLAMLQKTIANLNKEIAALEEETGETEAEIKNLQDKIMEVGGIRLRSQKAKVDGLREQMTTLSSEMSAAEVAKVKAEKAKIKHDKAYAEAGKELESLASAMAELDVEIQKQSQEHASSKRAAEEAQEELELKREGLQELRSKLESLIAELNDARGAELELKNQLDENQKILSENQKRHKYWQEKLSKLVLQNISENGETGDEQELPIHSKDELDDLDKDMLKGEIAALEERTQNANVELSVLADYRKRAEEYRARASDLAEAVAQRDSAKRRCEELRRLRLEGFMEGFSSISLRLKEMYQMITMGGNAELELVDSLDPFSEGILFSVMPPKKSWKNISNLSGGEKTLSSLALVFALHHYKPTPLYVMDEIDAALDFRNVSIVASYIKERTRNAQFIVISLRNNMFELASRLVGVYKVNHMTKSVTIENRDYITRPT